ncbi:MAG: pyrroline-5-carboxylate reductase [Pseudomonadota bacterium]
MSSSSARSAITPERPLVLVGAGKMGGALLEGWLSAGRAPQTILVVDPDPVGPLMKTDGLRVVAEPPATPGAAVVLAVKPQVMGEVLPAVKRVCDEATVVISVAAGTTIATLEALGPGPKVRTIPNTPSAVGKGMTVAVAVDAQEADIALADDLLKAVGLVRWVDREELIDPATAVSGSGPAYVFHLVEALAEAGIKQGLPKDVAEVIARQTIIGAGALLEASALDPGTLRQNVTSPGGTTAAALGILADSGALRDLMGRAVDAATRRSRELGAAD